MKKILLSAAVAAGAIMGLSGSASADGHCGSLTMSEMNWASAELMANIDKIILEAGYGCEVELIAGATMTTFASMNEKGVPDVAPELWINAVREPLDAAMAEGRLHSVLADAIDSASVGEGWFVPPHTLKNHPELKTALDVIERPDLFPHPEDPSKGGFVGCPAGWGCQLANDSLFRAFDMEAKGWLMIDPGSAAGLDGSMAKAAERGENWIGYYWGPTALVGRYNMQMIDFGVPFAGSENWDGCIVKPEQECADPKPSAWTPSEIHTVVTDRLIKEGSPAIGYFKKRVFPGAAMDEMLIYMNDEQATGADAALEFVAKHEAVWSKWVSAEAAAKIKASM